MLAEEREDRPAYVRFERRAIEDPKATLKAGRSVCKDVDFALVTPPYSKDCVEYKVSTWLTNMEFNVRNKRIPQTWADQWKRQLENWRNGQETPLNGTDIRNWPVISPAQCSNLINAGCRTVEDLANANDEAIRRIGMGSIDLKKKAIAYIQAAENHGPLVVANADLERKVAQLKGTIASLQDKISKLSNHTQDESDSLDISASDIFDEPDLEAARELYAEKFGKPPHHAKKYETIMRELDQ